MKKIFVNNNYRRPSQSIYLLNRPSTMQQKERKIQLPESRSCYVRSLSFAVRAFGMESRKLHAAPKATMPTASVSTGRAPQVDRLGLVCLCYNPLVLILQCALHAFNRLLGWWYLRYKSFNSWPWATQFLLRWSFVHCRSEHCHSRVHPSSGYQQGPRLINPKAPTFFLKVSLIISVNPQTRIFSCVTDQWNIWLCGYSVNYHLAWQV